MFPDVFSNRSRQGQSTPGGPGGSADVQTQAFVNSTLVTVVHNLGRRPLVQVELGTGQMIYGDVQHQNLNQFSVEFGIQVSGSVLYI